MVHLKMKISLKDAQNHGTLNSLKNTEPQNPTDYLQVTENLKNVHPNKCLTISKLPKSIKETGQFSWKNKP